MPLYRWSSIIFVTIWAWPVPLLLAAAGHPGQHIDLRISISDEEVMYDIILSTDLSNTILPNDYSRFTPARDDGLFRFVDPEDEKRTWVAFDEFFKDQNPVTVDGVLVKPILRRLEFVPNAVLAGPDDPYSFPPDARVVLAYPVKGRPKQVSMVWDLYPQDAGRAAFGLEPAVEVMAELDAYDENKIVVFTIEEPELIWHATTGKAARQKVSPIVVAVERAIVPIPLLSLGVVVILGAALLVLRLTGVWHASRRLALVLSIVSIGVAVFGRNVLVVRFASPWGETVKLPDEREATDLFASLHRNVYRAFDYKTEGDIYDVLAQSVAGDLLDAVYNEVYQSLILRDQGGAVARVQSVDILDADVESSGVEPDTGDVAFRIRSRWQVHGAVYHWGHVHSRTNEYTSRYTVAQRGGQWKITGVDVLEQRRIVKEDDDPPVPPRGTLDDPV